MERVSIKTLTEIERFRNLADRANEIFIQNIRREVDYSDAPEEFKGGIFFILFQSNYLIKYNF
jgi:hypothetical protein